MQQPKQPSVLRDSYHLVILTICNAVWFPHNVSKGNTALAVLNAFVVVFLGAGLIVDMVAARRKRRTTAAN